MQTANQQTTDQQTTDHQYHKNKPTNRQTGKLSNQQNLQTYKPTTIEQGYLVIWGSFHGEALPHTIALANITI